MSDARLAGWLWLALAAQLGLSLVLLARDRTPAVGESGELVRQALLVAHGLPDPPQEWRPLPPLLPVLLGGWFRVCGGGRTSVQAACLLSYVALVLASALLGRALGGRAAGILAGTLAAGLPGLVGPSRYPIPDAFAAVPLTVGLWLLACGPARRTRLAAGLAVGAALLCKPSLGLYAAPLAAWAAWRLVARRDASAALFGLGLCVAAPWYVVHGPAMLAYYGVDAAAAGPAVWGMSRTGPAYLLYVPRTLLVDLLGPVLGLVWLASLPLAVQAGRRRWAAFGLAVLVLATLAPFRVPRYLMPLLPALAAMTGVGLARAGRPGALAGALCLAGLAGSVGAARGWGVGDRLDPATVLHAEDLAGVGLFEPCRGDWRAAGIARELRSRAHPESLVVVIGARQLAYWPQRLALLEAGLDLPWTVPRLWPHDAQALPEVMRIAHFVLWSDYSIEARDRARGNLWPATAAEADRRGYTIEARARWLLHNPRDAFVERARTVTPDGYQLVLLERR